MHKVSFSQSWTTIYKEWIISLGRRFCNSKSCCMSILVASSYDKVFKIKFWIKYFFFVENFFRRSSFFRLFFIFVFFILIRILQYYAIFIVKDLFKSTLKICEISVFYCGNYKLFSLIRLNFYVNYIKIIIYLSDF